MAGRRVKVIGHRGARQLEPENTIRSFRRAMALGVDAIECDVRLSRDGHAVLMHDENVARTTNGSGLVADLGFEEIRALDAGKGERVPTLDELLDLVRGTLCLHVELKDPRALRPVLGIVVDRGARDWVYLTSFDTGLHERMRREDASIRSEHIFSDPPPDAIARALRVRAQRVSCRFDHLEQDFVDQAHEGGIEVIAWPPNTPEEMRLALSYGVDLICTDRPDVLIDLLAKG